MTDIVKAAVVRSKATRSELTPLRQMILDVLVSAGRPLGAYDIITHFQMTIGRRLLPPSVYRSLSALLDCGLITRIESKNAYLAHTQAMAIVADIHLICDQCGVATAVEAPALANLIEHEAAHRGFRIGKRVVEMQGICNRCQRSGIDGSDAMPADTSGILPRKRRMSG